MYSKILVPVDNSKYSGAAIEVAVALGAKCGATLVGYHIFAAQLHDGRFRDMELGLPARYREERELERQRSIHNSLITDGLRLISQSYLDAFQRRCQVLGISFEKKMAEGRNYVGILQELDRGEYDLVVLGSLGLGATDRSLIGGVCERVVRKARTDILVAREDRAQGSGRVLIATDGSPYSFMAVKRGLALAKALDLGVEVVSAFDPGFHRVAFQSIATVLSEEAGRVFRFKEQERLHEEIIDKGLERLYRGYLETAVEVAREHSQEIHTTLLAGKPYREILGYAEALNPWLLVVGRFGAHRTDYSDLGNTAENLVRLAPCSVLVVSGKLTPPPREHGEPTEAAIPWSEEAQQRLAKIPDFVRGIARNSIEEWARVHGYQEVTPEVMRQARESLGM